MTPALASLQQKAHLLVEQGEKTSHLLVILPSGGEWHEAPDHVTAVAALQRKGKKPAALAKQALTLDLPGGCLSSWVRLDDKQGAALAETVEASGDDEDFVFQPELLDLLF